MYSGVNPEVLGVAGARVYEESMSDRDTVTSLSRATLGGLALLSTVACSGPPPEELTGASVQDLHLAAGPRSLSFEYAHPQAIIPAGVAGGEKVVFVGSPIDGRVMVLSRVGGEQI